MLRNSGCNLQTPVVVPSLINFLIAAQDVPEEKPKFMAFTGTGKRLDGRPAKQQESASVAAPSAVHNQAKSATGNTPSTGSSAETSTSSNKTGRPGGKLVFGSNSSRALKDTQKVCKLLCY
jgi:ubiquitin fusion degradation protein 1